MIELEEALEIVLSQVKVLLLEIILLVIAHALDMIKGKGHEKCAVLSLPRS